MKRSILLPTSLLLTLGAACGGGEELDHAPHDGGAGDHSEMDHDGMDHDESDHDAMGHDGDHADGDHVEVPLGTATLGDLEVELAQGHGAVEAGKESHLVVKLPYSDDGETVVRAWIGTEDRTLSYVGKGEYAPSHDDYDVHAVAPDPLPEGAQWWVALQRPDGTELVGSIAPRLE